MLAQQGDIIGGRYQITGALGEGGFSEVHRGIDRVLEREVAIKLMAMNKFVPQGMDPKKVNADMIERFQKEARIVARLKDPATITLFDFGSEPNGMLYMVLELIEGRTLRDILNTRGALDVFSAVKILRQTLESLREAHLFGLIHRDIKPENIMIFRYIDDPWMVRVVDFGIAKAMEESASAMTAAGILTGTIRYVPPERLNKQPILPASDLYSLGCVMYFVLTGREVYPEAQTPMKIIAEQRAPQNLTLPASLDIPDTLREVVEKLLHKDTSTRYSSAQQVLDDIELLGVELQIARHGLGVEDLKAAVAMTQTMPAIGLGLDESSAATIQMNADQIPGLSEASDLTVPVSLEQVSSPEPAHLSAQQALRTTGPQGLPDPRFVSGGHNIPDPRLVTSPRPFPAGPQLAPGAFPTTQPTQTSQLATPESPTHALTRTIAGLTKQQKILLGFLAMAFLLGGLFTVIMLVIFIVR